MTGANVLLAVIDSISPALLYAKTNEKGDFCFFLNGYYDNRDLVIQLADSGYRRDLTWIIENKNLSDIPEMVAFRPGERQKEYLQNIRELRLIEAVFGNGYDTVMAPVLTPVYNEYFLHPDKVTRPAEYVNLRNFNEMDDNILPFIRFFRRDNLCFMSDLTIGPKEELNIEFVGSMLEGNPVFRKR